VFKICSFLSICSVFPWFGPWYHSCLQYLIFAGQSWTLPICSYFSEMFVISRPKCTSRLSYIYIYIYIYEEAVFTFHLIHSVYIIYGMSFFLSFIFTWYFIMFPALNATFILVLWNNLVMVLTEGPKYVKVTHLSFRIVCGLSVDDFCFLTCEGFSFFTISAIMFCPLFYFLWWAHMYSSGYNTRR
jgi:hypothetical protein